jgi:hypothetical protein
VQDASRSRDGNRMRSTSTIATSDVAMMVPSAGPKLPVWSRSDAIAGIAAACASTMKGTRRPLIAP